MAENIVRFSEVDAQKVVDAARLADVHDTILSLHQGYDTVIGSTVSELTGEPIGHIAELESHSISEDGMEGVENYIEQLGVRNATL